MTLTGTPIEVLSTAEKLQALDALWEALQHHLDDVPTPRRHESVLKDRLARLAAGDTGFGPLEDVRERLRQQFT